MTPERFRQLGQIYHSALELDPLARNAFLDIACGQDSELRREVESLIAAHNNVGDYFAAPAAEVAALMAEAQPTSLEGRTIGHYNLIRKIGEGGMGAVFLGHDTSLDRQVAIKFISLDSAEDRVARKRLRKRSRCSMK